MQKQTMTLSNRKKTFLIDEEDYEKVSQYSWFLKESRGGWYVCASMRVGDKVYTLRLHRWLMNAPEGMTVDHLNGDVLDCRKSNLEVVTNQENIRRRWARTRCEIEGQEPTYEDDIPF